MTDKDRKKWRKIYENMLAITEMQPWSRIDDDVPLLYFPEGQDKPMIFSVWGNTEPPGGIALYLNEYEYIYACHRVEYDKAGHEMGFMMRNMLLGVWCDREEVVKGGREVIKELGYKFRGKGGWLCFESYAERREPVLLSGKELDVMADALGHLKLMLEAVFKNGKQVDFEGGETIARKKGEDGKWQNALVGYTDVMDTPLPETTVGVNSQGMKALTAMPASDRAVELGEYMVPMPEYDNKAKVTYFTLLVLAADADTGEPLNKLMVPWNMDRELALFEFICRLSEEGGRPERIIINDEFTRASLADLCEKAGIKLEFREKELEHLDGMIQGVLSAAMAQVMALMEDVEPSPKPKPKKKKGDTGHWVIASGKTFVISVSAGTGCYRHIRISGDETLEGLHSVILDAFEFDDDHAHAFFLNNRFWSDGGYYSRYIEDAEKFTCDYTLAQVLNDKQKFAYIFDFGDEWRFQCRVLRVLEETCDEPEIVRAAGEAPKQYPDFDEE